MGIYKIRTEFGQHLRWLMGILAVIFIIGGAFMFGGMPGANRNSQGGGVTDEVATVGGMPITRGEMEAAWAQVSEELHSRGERSTLGFALQRADVFQFLIESRVTLITAKAMGVEISNREVNTKRDEMIGEFLRENRRRVLGKLDTAHDKTDPRDDSEYKAELAKGGLSLGEMEDRAKTFISEGVIQFELARDGIRRAVEEKAGKVSDQDIKNSYNVYSIRQIVIPKASLPSEQLQSQVGKIVSEARGGGDFAALGKKYSADPSKGGIQAVSYGMVAPEVWDQLGKIKPGGVGAPIDTPQAAYIVKVESMTSKLPAKFDKKTQDDRRKAMESMLQMQVYYKYEQEVRSKLVVNVIDPELRGYWNLNGLVTPKYSTVYKYYAVGLGDSPPPIRPQPTLVEAKKKMSLARNALEKAVGKEPNNSFATAMLALVLRQQGDNKHATQLLYQLLEGKDSKGVGSDLRIMLGDLLYQAGKKDEAMKQYGKASEAAGVDMMAHQQLIAKYKEIGRADLAANEQKRMAEYEAKKKQFEARQRKPAPGAPRPGTPVPGGGQ